MMTEPPGKGIAVKRKHHQQKKKWQWSVAIVLASAPTVLPQGSLILERDMRLAHGNELVAAWSSGLLLFFDFLLPPHLTFQSPKGKAKPVGTEGTWAGDRHINRQMVLCSPGESQTDRPC